MIRALAPLAVAAALLAGCGHPHQDDWYNDYDAGARPDVGRSGDGRRIPSGCDRVVGVPPDAVLDADVIPIGVLLPETGVVGGVGLSMIRAVVLASRELEALGPRARRRFAAVICDTGSDPARAAELAEGLVYDLAVSAIVGPALSTSATQIEAVGVLDLDVLFVSPSATSPALAALDDHDRLWQIAPSDARLGTALGRILAEGDARAVTIIAGTDPRSAGVADAVAPAWCGGPCPVGAVRRLDYAAAPVTLDVGETDAVVVAMPADAAARVVAELDGYAGPILVDDGLRDPARLAALPPAAAAAIEGVGHRLTGADARFVAAYRETWGDDPGVFAAHAYDALWLAAHALAAEGAANVGGDALVTRLRRMSAGEPIATGPDDFDRGQRLLADARSGVFNAIGASGSLDFDRSGQAPAPVERWRWAGDAGEVRPGEVVVDADE